MSCSCRCISCGSVDLESKQVSESEDDGYFDMHHTCKKCKTHFDHLEGNVFKSCNICGYEIS